MEIIKLNIVNMDSMSVKTKLLILVTVIGIFFSYYTLSPMSNGISKLGEHDYSLKILNVNDGNKWSTFKNEKGGVFFIHPGKEKAVSGTFTYNKPVDILLDFSIRKGSEIGDIAFIVKKNNEEVDRFIVTPNNSYQVSSNVKTGERLEIIADKHGSTSADWGNLQITLYDSLFQYKNFLIPFLWSILFVFLLAKKHFFIAVNSYLIFLLMLFAEKLNFGVLGFGEVLTYTFLTMSMAFVFIFIFQTLHLLKKYKIAPVLSYALALALCIVPMLFIVYVLNYGTTVTQDILYAVFQTNSSESTAYVSDFIAVKLVIAFAFIAIGIGVLFFLQVNKEIARTHSGILLLMIAILILLTSFQFTSLKIPKLVSESISSYYQELKLFRETQAKRKAGEIQFSANKKETGETYIVVIGESLHKKHMGVYGYLRNTTPNLSEMNKNGELFVFQNAYSNHTHTITVLSLALTEANQINKKTYYESLSIVDVLNQADVETYWLTNQILHGAWDNMVSVVASEADHLVGVNRAIGAQATAQEYDGVLIKEVEKVLATTSEKNRVLFIHLMGNHTSYSARYPKDQYNIYNGELKKGDFGSLVDVSGLSKNINSYDNSVVYNDYVITSFLKILQKQKGSTGLVYMPDHADDAIGKLGHNSSKFTFEMAQIPMIAWFSEEYKSRYSKKFNTFKKNTNTLFSNDFFYDTMIGLFGINTERYEPAHDLSSEAYKLPLEQAYVLHNKKRYIDKSNYIWWQKANARFLINNNQSARVFPHRVNSIGKLKDIWNDGFRSFELDVRFGDDGTNVFQVGHNDGEMGGNLESFLSAVQHSEIQRVWLDFKNLNNSNYKQALERLRYLDKKFDLKDKFIVESGTKSAFFQKLKQGGWHTSYYAPTGKIVKLLEENNVVGMKQLAIKLAEQSSVQKLSAISFDNRLYPFIKHYVEPLITDDIVYHIWYGPAIYKDTFKTELLKNELFLDKRIKTILVPYKSQFNL